jgi:hypothetical protein
VGGVLIAKALMDKPEKGKDGKDGKDAKEKDKDSKEVVHHHHHHYHNGGPRAAQRPAFDGFGGLNGAAAGMSLSGVSNGSYAQLALSVQSGGGGLASSLPGNSLGSFLQGFTQQPWL